jgi:hypothetical protein
MPTAGFESTPQAEQVATILREQGYDSRLVVRSSDDFAERSGRFFKGDPPPFEPQAFVVSEDAEFEPFARAAQRHYGIIIEEGSTE